MNHCIQDFNILQNIGVAGSFSHSPKIIEVMWIPLFSWTKVNTYGMALGSPGKSVVGGIFRTYRGFSKGDFCRFVGNHTAFKAELLAFIQAINIAWAKIWTKL